jgi:16S rRNA (guanine1207-N2)-methyltransferase
MAAEHYFSAQPSSDPEIRPLGVVLAGRELDLVTAGGVFSPGGLDVGTGVLLASVPPPPPGGNLLDLGCGWGPIALTLALESPHATVWAVDVNERALDLTRRNAEILGLTNIRAVRPEEIPDDVAFRTIWSNPPIRVGKSELHSMLSRWLPRLADSSEAWLVVARNLGADSLQRWIEAEHGEELRALRAETSKGFRVLRIRRRGPVSGSLPILDQSA